MPSTPSHVNLRGKVGFAVGTGRCGTTFLYQLLSREPSVSVSHERNCLLESFHKYCCWNELPVDQEGFLAEKEREIRADLETADFSFESSGHLSFSIASLYERFQAKFVLLVRNPLSVTASYVRKGYYRQPYVQHDSALALGYQQAQEFHHYLGRIVPRNNEFRRWNQMTQVGKVAWFWKAVNLKALELFERLPTQDKCIIRIEDFDYAQYQTLAHMLGINVMLDADQFNAIRNRRPNSSKSSQHVPRWSEEEISEFESEVGDLATRLDYPRTFDENVAATNAERQLPAATVRGGRFPFANRRH